MNRKPFGILMVVGLVVAGAGPRARADLVGTSVTGSLFFGSQNLNAFDPVYHQVPAGYGNTSSTTVVISDSVPTFGFRDGLGTDSAAFTGNSLTISLAVSSDGDFFSQSYTFTDTAFTGVSFSLVSDSYGNGGLSFSQTGDQIKVTWPGGNYSQGANLVAVYSTGSAAATPEPATVWFAMLGGVAFAGYGWRRSRAGRASA